MIDLYNHFSSASESQETKIREEYLYQPDLSQEEAAKNNILKEVKKGGTENTAI